MDRQAFLLLFLLFASCSLPLQSEFFPCTHSIAKNKTSLLDKVNKYRIENGISELYRDGRLSVLAQKRAEELAKSANPSHLDKQGRGPLERLQARGLRRGFVGENFTFLFSDKDALDQLFLTWAQAKRERRNLLSQNYARIGIGLALRGRHCVAVALFTD